MRHPAIAKVTSILITVILILYLSIDLVRKLYEPGFYVIAFLFALFIFFFLSLYSNALIKRAIFLHVPVTTLAIPYLMVLFFSLLLNFNSFVYLIEYIAPLFAFYIGYLLYFNKQNFDKLYLSKLLSLILFVICAFVYLQLFFSSVLSYSLLPPLELSERSWGDGFVTLYSSIFASSKRLGRFIVIGTIILLFFGSLDYKKNILLFFMFGAIIISGARESILMFLLVIFIFKFNFLRNNGNNNRQLLVVAILASLVYIILKFSDGFIFALSDEDDDSIFYRILALFPIINLDLYDELGMNVFFGNGAGAYNILVESFGENQTTFAIQSVAGFSGVAIIDSGILKVTYELGILVSILLILFFIYNTVLLLRSISSKYLRYDLLLFTVWFIYFLKIHVILKDIPFNCFLFTVMGFMTAKHYINNKHIN